MPSALRSICSSRVPSLRALTRMAKQPSDCAACNQRTWRSIASRRAAASMAPKSPSPSIMMRTLRTPSPLHRVRNSRRYDSSATLPAKNVLTYSTAAIPYVPRACNGKSKLVISPAFNARFNDHSASDICRTSGASGDVPPPLAALPVLAAFPAPPALPALPALFTSPLEPLRDDPHPANTAPSAMPPSRPIAPRRSSATLWSWAR